jgi:hypothetical protein
MITQQVGQFFMNTISQGQQLDISAGQTLNLALGGKGRPVEGQITIPPFLAARHDWIWDTNSTARHHSPQADIPMPDDVKNGTDDQKQKWMTAFMQSPAGKTYVDALNKEMSSPSYPTEFSNDGKFRIEDVPPGNYSLNASILMPSPQYGGYNPDGPLATAQSSFTVPEIPGGQSDEPLKLPPIQMTVIPRADVGQPAPDFAMKTADAKELKLSDFKGKYALIVFYLPGPQAARSELPILASVADSFGGENRLSMIGIDVFGPADASKNYGQPNGMSWTSASLQKAGNLSAVKSFQLKAFPSIWLIGPDGIIVAKNLQGDAVKTALTAALGPQGL